MILCLFCKTIEPPASVGAIKWNKLRAGGIRTHDLRVRIHVPCAVPLSYSPVFCQNVTEYTINKDAFMWAINR